MVEADYLLLKNIKKNICHCSGFNYRFIFKWHKDEVKIMFNEVQKWELQILAALYQGAALIGYQIEFAAKCRPRYLQCDQVSL